MAENVFIDLIKQTVTVVFDVSDVTGCSDCFFYDEVSEDCRIGELFDCPLSAILPENPRSVER